MYSTRLRFGGRTNQKLQRNLFLSGYGAYGFEDQRWKWNGVATWSFNNQIPRMFPNNQVTIAYQNDIRAPGVNVTDWSPSD